MSSGLRGSSLAAQLPFPGEASGVLVLRFACTSYLLSYFEIDFRTPANLAEMYFGEPQTGSTSAEVLCKEVQSWE